MSLAGWHRAKPVQAGAHGNHWLNVCISAILGREPRFEANRTHLAPAAHSQQPRKKKKKNEKCCILHQQKCAKRAGESGSLLFNPAFSLVFFRFLFFLAAHFSAACGAILRSCYANTHLWLTLLYYNQSSHPACVLRESGGECFQKHATVKKKKNTKKKKKK